MASGICNGREFGYSCLKFNISDQDCSFCCSQQAPAHTFAAIGTIPLKRCGKRPQRCTLYFPVLRCVPSFGSLDQFLTTYCLKLSTQPHWDFVVLVGKARRLEHQLMVELGAGISPDRKKKLDCKMIVACWGVVSIRMLGLWGILFVKAIKTNTSFKLWSISLDILSREAFIYCWSFSY